MRFMKRCLAGLLVGSLMLGAAGASARRSESPKAEGAGAERDRGRELLRRGRAGEALVHLENALKAYKQSGDRAGEASTRDLLGELYERQGRYDLAQEHYTVAQNIYAASAGGGRSAPNVPGGGAPAADVVRGAA